MPKRKRMRLPNGGRKCPNQGNPTSEFRRMQTKNKTFTVPRENPLQKRIMSPNQIKSAVCFIFQYHAIKLKESRAKKKYNDFYLHVEPLRVLYLSWSLSQWHPHNAFSHHEKPFLVLILDISYQGRILKFPAVSSSRRHCRFTRNGWYLWAIWGFAYSIFLDDSRKQQ